jgi:topoisomerase IA-like protein
MTEKSRSLATETALGGSGTLEHVDTFRVTKIDRYTKYVTWAHFEKRNGTHPQYGEKEEVKKRAALELLREEEAALNGGKNAHSMTDSRGATK